MVRPKKEQKLIIQVKLNGEGVSPGTISILDLSAISSALQNAIAKSAAELDLSELGCPVMALTSVREGCGIFEFAFPKKLRKTLFATFLAISTGQFSEIGSEAHAELYKVSQRVLNCKFSLEIEPQPRIVPKGCFISNNHPISEPVVEYTNGTTTICVEVIRVGGAKDPTAILSFGDENLTATVGRDLAKKLAARLYETVVLSGDATWESGNPRPVKFNINAISEFQDTPIDQAFQGLADLCGDLWDDVDAVEYVRELREG